MQLVASHKCGGRLRPVCVCLSLLVAVLQPGTVALQSLCCPGLGSFGRVDLWGVG
jgi:hypothetical protein